jgi:putative FmdB family regulatory protein
VPTYEYACKKCGERFDVVQSFSDKTLSKHPGCGGDVQKVFHPAGIIFKGSGFYVTDSKSSSSKSTSSKPSSSKSTSSKSTSSKPGDTKSSDSKPSGSEGDGS